jgi:hypothetical protein
MKIRIQFKYIVFVLLAAFLSSFTNKTSDNPDSRLIGTWTAAMEEKGNSVRFDSNGFVYFIFDKFSVGGPNFEGDGMMARMEFSTSIQDSINTLDIIVYNNSNDTVYSKAQGIYKFEGDYLFMNIEFEKPVRPVTFNNPNTVRFARKE